MQRLDYAIEEYHRGGVSKPASMGKLALKYGIPRSVINRTISGKRARDGHVGRPPSIPLNLEMQIVQYAVDMDAHGFGLTLKNIRAIAQDVASKYGIQLKASWKWLSGLYWRHPELAKRRAQAFERVQASGMNREQVAEYFNVLESCYQICCGGGEVAAMDADFVWNLDETNVQQDLDGCWS